jgi:hypothetical protein
VETNIIYINALSITPNIITRISFSHPYEHEKVLGSLTLKEESRLRLFQKQDPQANMWAQEG